MEISKRLLLVARARAMAWSVPPEQAALLTQMFTQLEADDKYISVLRTWHQQLEADPGAEIPTE